MTVPVVSVTAGDSVTLGLVASLSRPGRSFTGAVSVEVGPKQVELLHELVPTTPPLIGRAA
jgi:putative tryptophan/tyrosine transport system substrate-binding protein